MYAAGQWHRGMQGVPCCVDQGWRSGWSTSLCKLAYVITAQMQWASWRLKLVYIMSLQVV